MVVDGVSIVKDAYEDSKRRQKDREENENEAMVCHKGDECFRPTLS